MAHQPVFSSHTICTFPSEKITALDLVGDWLAVGTNSGDVHIFQADPKATSTPYTCRGRADAGSGKVKGLVLLPGAGKLVAITKKRVVLIDILATRFPMTILPQTKITRAWGLVYPDPTVECESFVMQSGSGSSTKLHVYDIDEFGVITERKTIVSRFEPQGLCYSGTELMYYRSDMYVLYDLISDATTSADCTDHAAAAAVSFRWPPTDPLYCLYAERTVEFLAFHGGSLRGAGLIGVDQAVQPSAFEVILPYIVTANRGQLLVRDIYSPSTEIQALPFSGRIVGMVNVLARTYAVAHAVSDLPPPPVHIVCSSDREVLGLTMKPIDESVRNLMRRSVPVDYAQHLLNDVLRPGADWIERNPDAVALTHLSVLLSPQEAVRQVAVQLGVAYLQRDSNYKTAFELFKEAPATLSEIIGLFPSISRVLEVPSMLDTKLSHAVRKAFQIKWRSEPNLQAIELQVAKIRRHSAMKLLEFFNPCSSEVGPSNSSFLELISLLGNLTARQVDGLGLCELVPHSLAHRLSRPDLVFPGGNCLSITIPSNTSVFDEVSLEFLPLTERCLFDTAVTALSFLAGEISVDKLEKILSLDSSICCGRLLAILSQSEFCSRRYEMAVLVFRILVKQTQYSVAHSFLCYLLRSATFESVTLSDELITSICASLVLLYANFVPPDSEILFALQRIGDQNLHICFSTLYLINVELPKSGFDDSRLRLAHLLSKSPGAELGILLLSSIRTVLQGRRIILRDCPGNEPGEAGIYRKRLFELCGEIPASHIDLLLAHIESELPEMYAERVELYTLQNKPRKVLAIYAAEWKDLDAVERFLSSPHCASDRSELVLYVATLIENPAELTKFLAKHEGDVDASESIETISSESLLSEQIGGLTKLLRFHVTRHRRSTKKLALLKELDEQLSRKVWSKTGNLGLIIEENTLCHLCGRPIQCSQQCVLTSTDILAHPVCLQRHVMRECDVL